ncbi:universal stress protein [soil metagenome]
MSIVVGYVPTPEGRVALQRAADEAMLRQVALIVVDAPASSRAHSGDQESGESELAAIFAQLSTRGISHERRATPQRGDLSDHLIATAEESGAEFIVIGLRRRSTVGKLILGSHAQRILLEAACPVLAVKAEDRV